MAKKHFLLTAVFGVVAAGMARPAQAQFYNNGLPDGQNGNEMTEWIQTEDFMLTGSTTLSGVTFWALTGTDAYDGSITWQIYDNNGGVPGSVLDEGSVSPTPVLYPGADADGYTGYQLDFTLPDIALDAGTYWLGLHNGPLTDTDYSSFYWATTDANGTSTGEEDIAPFGDDSWNNNGYEHAFELYAATGNVTPEPASLTLLAMGLVGLSGAGMRRRRARSA